MLVLIRKKKAGTKLEQEPNWNSFIEYLRLYHGCRRRFSNTLEDAIIFR